MVAVRRRSIRAQRVRNAAQVRPASEHVLLRPEAQVAVRAKRAGSARAHSGRLARRSPLLRHDRLVAAVGACVACGLRSSR